MKIFLTGGTGFIGSYVAKALSDAGHEILILARNPNKVPALHKLPGISMIEGEINDYSAIARSLKGMDTVIHVGLNYRDGAVEMLQGDTQGSVYLFEQAAKSDIKQMIYTSSTAVVDFLYMTDDGKTYKGEINEEMRMRPATYYGATKAATEHYLMALSYQYPVKINIIRPGYIFGNPGVPGAPVQPDNRFKNIVKNALENKDIELVKNDGTQFLWAGDIAGVYLALLESNLNRETFFALSTRFTTWEHIARTAVEMCHSTSRIIITDKGYDDNPRLFDVSKMKNMLGLEFDNLETLKEHISFWIKMLK